MIPNRRGPRDNSEHVPADRRRAILVLDPGTRHALAAVRAIGRAGWRAIVAGGEHRRDAIAAASRYCAAYHRIPNIWGPGRPVEAAISELVDRYHIDAALLCSDVTIARLRQLSIGIPTVPELSESLDRVTDKLELQDVCAMAGVMYPETVPTRELPTTSLSFPLIVKPRRTAIATSDRVVSRTGASVVRTHDELQRAIQDLTALGLEPIVQRRVDRAFKVNVSFIRRSARTTFRIAYRVLSEQPHEGGLAATIETIDPDSGTGSQALEQAIAACDAAGYGGLANVEFYGQRDGQLCMIEINARPWGSLAFPEALGLGPTVRAVEDALGLPQRAPVPYSTGRRFHRPTLELKLLASPPPQTGGRRRILLGMRPYDTYDVLDPSDPAPVAVAMGQVVQRGLAMLKASLTRR